MVQLTRIYTRGGDKGKTSLGTGKRVAKHDQRVAAFGAVDEANAAIGLVRLHAPSADVDAMLSRIQNDMFDLGADLCTPDDGTKVEWEPLRIVASQVERLEHAIDAMNAELEPLRSFILPGGSGAVAALHVARTVVRRAERAAVALHEREPLNPQLLAYLNRLSDLLFVTARYVAAKEGGDVLWRPGATRDE